MGVGHLGEIPTAIIALAPGAQPSPGELLTRPDGALLATPQGWKRIRIERMLPRFGVDFEVDCYPQEACVESLAVSFNKGCYTGQEIVARLESRGKPGHRLVGLAFDAGEPAEIGARIQDGERSVGELTSACISPAAGAIGLGFVRSASAQPGTDLCVGEIRATVASLPFVA